MPAFSRSHRCCAGDHHGGEAFTLHHPYDVPELLVFPSHAGLEGYLNWVRTDTSGLQCAANA